jgi:hypothetical protein
MSELPTMQRTTKPQAEPAKPVEQMETNVATNFRVQVPVLTVSIPYLECEYDRFKYSTQTKRFDAGRLTRQDWETIRAIRNGFSTRGDIDKDGRTIDTPIAAFRMLLAEVREVIRKMDITESD